jgi:hypothetical protein
MTKVRAIRWYARHYQPRFFVETGTGLGDTPAAVADLLAQCFTIEPSAELHQFAAERLSKIANVRCLQGDSGRPARTREPKPYRRTLIPLLRARSCCCSQSRNDIFFTHEHA